MTRDVVLVPGLWMPGIAMTVLQARLAKAGYAPRVFVYRGRAPHEANVEALARFVHEQVGNRPAHFVGHSLGGVVILDMLARHRGIRAATAVLLGAPVRGCMAGRRLGRHALGRWMLGECAPRWQECEARWERPEPLGVVAATRPFGLGRVLGPLPGDNDGVVRVEETTVQGMAQRVLVREGHSVLIVSARVARMVCGFFEKGRFD